MPCATVIVNVGEEHYEHARMVLRELRSSDPVLKSLHVVLRRARVEEDCFYAVNEVRPCRGLDRVVVTVSSCTPKGMLGRVLAVELYKAYLYYSNPALRRFRWEAGRLFYGGPGGLLERAVYARLVDTVENCAVTTVRPWLSRLFVDLYMDVEVYDDPVDYMVSQAMLAPAYASGLAVPQVNLDEVEALTLLLTAYGAEIARADRGDVGAEIAVELYGLARSVVSELKGVRTIALTGS